VSLFAKLSAELPIDREIAALKIRHIILAAQEKRSAIADALADGEWQGGRGGDGPLSEEACGKSSFSFVNQLVVVEVSERFRHLENLARSWLEQQYEWVARLVKAITVEGRLCERSRMTPERALSLGGKGRRTRSAWIGSARSSLDVFMSMTRCLHCGRGVGRFERRRA